ncbi:MerR family transcriptional regulator [Paenibacillus nasutitermitis]|uniref:HTH-type transcriptional regulator YfmP n=1 Tax=Paenibacillus nasutitermitis TaxID=1652958 RepID=A0A917E0Y4_9BACL|nr:MerR family transcriptional regulator [Paenibacillus nasutitermitis]GGD86569.1 HTH-type transcriptional regulator YfmP [Paenibacillus nasutitermitis]
MGDRKYSIEEVTQRLGVTARTLHYYEEIGLIREVERTAGGHRLYSEQVTKEMEHILRLKNILGCSLQEIRAILDAEEQLTVIRESYHQEDSDSSRHSLLDQAAILLGRQVSLIEEKVAGMLEMKERFQERLDRVESKREGK